MKNNIVTRIAPSPTGWLHIGTARTALFNYLYAKKNDGQFILRIDDTDKERSTKEFEENIIDTLKWLNLDFDKAFRQSERTDLYKKYLEKLISEDSAYISKEENAEEGERDEVIRFRNKGLVITFEDTIHGEITFDTSELGDFVIAKSLEEPLYHFASAVDDIDMGITHVIRGEDHISNTPRQILILEACGGQRPIYTHMPLILAPDKSKLSKRHGAVAVTEYAKEGYLPEALINFMALLGWSPQAKTSAGTETSQEIFSLEELVNIFSLEGMQKSPAVFNIEKLKWINKEHMKAMPKDEIKRKISYYLPAELSEKQTDLLSDIIFERINFFHEIKHLWEAGDFDFVLNKPQPTKEMLKTVDHIASTIEILEQIKEEDFEAEKIKNSLWDFATEKGRGEVLWPMRVALTGKEKSPDPFIVAQLLGKQETLARLQTASLI